MTILGEFTAPAHGDARWNTLTGGASPERYHLVEGWIFGDETLLPVEVAQPGSLLVVAMLTGELEWRQGRDATVLKPGRIAGFLDEEGIHLVRRSKDAAHLLVWRFQRGTLRASMEALGLPLPSQVLCWPIAPRLLTAEMQALILELRSEPSHGTARAWWYGAKLLELTALLHPPTENTDAGAPGGVREPIRRALVFMQQSFAEPISLADIARVAGLSPTHLSRIFSDEAGVPLRHYLRQLRMERAAQLLRSGQCNVTEAAMSVGYTSIGQFSRTFRELYGQSPGALLPSAHRKTE